MNHRPLAIARAWTCLSILGMGLLGSCAPQGSLRLVSGTGNAQLPLQLRTAVHSQRPDGGIDFYLTDLPPERWHPQADLQGVSGTLAHVNAFLSSSGSGAPIASNATIRIVVLARGEAGVYVGGGAWRPGTTLDDDLARGQIRSGTLSLARATPAFRDALGPSTISGLLTAPRDERTAQILRARLLAILDATPPATTTLGSRPEHPPR